MWGLESTKYVRKPVSNTVSFAASNYNLSAFPDDGRRRFCILVCRSQSRRWGSLLRPAQPLRPQKPWRSRRSIAAAESSGKLLPWRPQPPSPGLASSSSSLCSFVLRPPLRPEGISDCRVFRTKLKNQLMYVLFV